MEERVQQNRKEEMKCLKSYLETSGRLREIMFAAQPLAALIMFIFSYYTLNE